MRTSTRLLLPTGGLLSLFVVACQPPSPHLLADRRECPHTWVDSLNQGDSLTIQLQGNVDLVAPVINVPEFHDCQLFLKKGVFGMKYTDFFAIWASWRLNSLPSDLGTRIAVTPPTGGGSVAGGGDIAGGISTAIATSTFAVPVAEVYAEGNYKPLGIKKWFNCLFLWRESGLWKAKMAPMGDREVQCDQIPADAIVKLEGTPLEVRPTVATGFTKDTDYPPVARWDWDSENSQQYIGIKCGAAWCEVGDFGFKSSLPLAVSPGDPEGLQRVKLIKGWHDRQLLSRMEKGEFVPTTIMGTILPDSSLESFDDAHDFPAGYTHVADVSFEGGDTDPGLAKYASRFNLAHADLGHPNTLSICKGIPVDCIAATTGFTAVIGPASSDCNLADKWSLSVTKPGGTSTLANCIHRYEAPRRLIVKDKSTGAQTDMGPLKVPGATRWRWMANDEGFWIRCKNGCCDVTW